MVPDIGQGPLGSSAPAHYPAMNPSPSMANRLSQWRIYFDRALAHEALGDLLMLAEEAPSSTLRIEARRLLAKRLLDKDHRRLARNQIKAILSNHPSDAYGRALLATIDATEARVTGASPRHGAQAVLFSGHMIDAPNRPSPRFPPDKESVAAGAIGKALDDIHVQSTDLAICGGACGGDTLFAEACLARGMRVQLYLQFEEPTFLDASVAFAGPQWVERYRRIASNARTRVRIMPRELGPAPTDTNAYERNNRWQLDNALAVGAVHCIALWNGQGGNGPGGTEHMLDTVGQYGGQVTILDTTLLWSPPQGLR
ncbi:hypothetical protein YTPLAS18_34190 [Nitrospira sp.]|nr:hypothetical protein YTPLAS18_34190 [Nitrospira sp.]